MKKQILLLLTLFISFYGLGQVITVKDSLTLQPIEMVSISSQYPRAFTTTNSKGQSDIGNFKYSTEVVLRYFGYNTKIIKHSSIDSANNVIYLSESGFNLAPFVVGVSKWKQNKDDIPNRITTISQKDIALQNPQTAADLLKSSGEVFVQKSQLGGGSPMIRGFATNRLLLSVDGTRMNNAIFRSGNLQNVISIDALALESVEILFGPGSVIYGSDAIGGVMSFQTLQPQFSADDTLNISGKFVTRFSTANQEKTGHFDFNLGWKKWATVSSVTFTDYGDLRMGKNGPSEYLRPTYVIRKGNKDTIKANENSLIQTPSQFSQINLMQKFRFKPNKIWDFNYDFHYSKTSDYGRYDRHLRTESGLPKYGEWKYGPQSWMMNSFYIVNQGENWFWDLATFKISQQQTKESRIQRKYNDNIRSSNYEKVDIFASNWDFNREINKKHHLYYGLEAIRNDVTSNGISEDISSGAKQNIASRYPNSVWASYGAYASFQYAKSEKFTIQAGARYNYFTLHSDFDTTYFPLPFTTADINNSALTGSLGLNYKVNKTLIISSNTSSGFRAPNVDDVGKIFDSEPGSIVVPNANLKAEYAYNQEFNFSKVVSKKLKIDLSTYYTYLKDAMVRRDFQLNGADSVLYDGTMSQVQAIQNVASATVYGFQISGELKMKKGFGLRSHFNMQTGVEEQANGELSPSRHAAPWFGSTHLTYKKKKVLLDLNAEYSGGKTYDQLPINEQKKGYIYAIDANGNPYSPSWMIANLKAQYSITKHTSVTAGVENILDLGYKTYSSGLVAPGRNFIISLKGTF